MTMNENKIKRSQSSTIISKYKDLSVTLLDSLYTNCLKYSSNLPVPQLIMSSEQNEPKIAEKGQNNKLFK